MAVALALLAGIGCNAAEPDFHTESLTEAPTETAARAPAPRGVEPLRARLSSTEIEQLISTEPVPEPFWPDDGELHYAPVPERGSALRSALRAGRPVLVDVLAVESPAPTDSGEVGVSIARARSVSTGELLEVEVPSPGACLGPTPPAPGERYVLLLDPNAPGDVARHRLLSTGLAVLFVSPDGTVSADSLTFDAATLDEAAEVAGAL
jgi:hypothetical protein